MSRETSSHLMNSIAASALFVVASCAQSQIAPIAQAQTPQSAPSAERTFVDQCKALDHMVIEGIGPNPGRIVHVEAVQGRKAEGRQNVMFYKRGNSQGNPTPKLSHFPDHCLVEGYVTPHVKFALMLPPASEWNGRYMHAACDAWCGKVHEEITVPGLHDGYATLTNDGGHYSRAPFDGTWAHDDIQAREYFAHRANHVTTPVGKAIVEAFYGKPANYSYLTGFSKGGNAGLFAAQKYPEDFDGIFVKAPVVKYNEKNAAHFTWEAKAIYPENDQSPTLTSDKAAIIQAAATAACDGYDGVVNGVIDDPRVCDFDPVVLRCDADQNEATDPCLNDAQIKTVQLLYTPPTLEDGTVYHEYAVDRGSETEWPMKLLPQRGLNPPGYPVALSAADTGIKYMALYDNPGPNYNWRDFDFVAETANLEPMSDILNPDETDLSSFRAAGGKIMIVHGWADPLISANMTLDWFEEMTTFMGGEEVVSEFAQFYLIPGLWHGSGGDGPDIYDAQTALVEWVENDKAPTELMVEDDPGDEPFRSRAFYPYPDISKYSGSGDVNKAESYIRVDK